MTGHLMTFARVDEQTALRFLRGRLDNRGPSNIHKKSRAIAKQEAIHRGLWKQGEASVYAKWWRKLLARFFPKLRKRYADWVGRWYKRTLKAWSHNIAASIHDRELQAIMRAREKINREFARERINRNISTKAR